MSGANPARTQPPDDASARSFESTDWVGLVAESLPLGDPAAEAARLADPASAVATLHWGRSYLYRARVQPADGPALDVVVKQFRNDGWRRRLDRRLRGSRAARAWSTARRLRRHGVPTPEPLLLVESRRPDGPSLYVCRHLADVVEARYVIRALNAGRLAAEHPRLARGPFLDALGELARDLHAAGVVHRDLSVGNVLVRAGEPGTRPRLFVVDLSRSRRSRGPGMLRRTRELTRLNLRRDADQRRFLAAYWGRPEERLGATYLLFRVLQASFRLKQPLKGRLRAPLRWSKKLTPRTTHPHIPPAPAGATLRDRSVWDPLSDQPHQHAGRLGRLRVRLSQASIHWRETRLATRVLRRAWPRYRELQRQPPLPFTFDGFGVGVRPLGEDPAPVVAAVRELGVRRVLLRLHPWDPDHTAEERLAAALADENVELLYALPQNRELVADPPRWRAAVEELGERFTRWGTRFQIGQAINRSKWGVWTIDEYASLAAAAAEILRRRPGVELLGPAVIDFEPLALAAALEHPRSPDLDIVSGLLYVDRRGAPENRQLGFDAAAKAQLFAALARTARHGSPRFWVTEFNWPLREGPHAPAGRDVAVDERCQADWLGRYLLATAATGVVERAYWWQLVARGYGLVDPSDGAALRRRPAFRALATLERALRGARLIGRLPAPDGCRLLHLHGPDESEFLAGWCVSGHAEIELPQSCAEVVEWDGEVRHTDTARVSLQPSIRLFRLRNRV